MKTCATNAMVFVVNPLNCDKFKKKKCWFFFANNLRTSIESCMGFSWPFSCDRIIEQKKNRRKTYNQIKKGITKY